ncbi:hypothetical protein B0T18DRAFT_420179 [Schizothecium vesticola]|uniref:SMODS and SLOG-associating 2TM effector domain-containing protein n=1 Tax=Schizothecium vesticola TaxID=314040 RepID=A0AA40ELA7_9PEZI|nr:hypothetical protein B0T18DRAFT_420179 [Schizothecium vesticola]
MASFVRAAMRLVRSTSQQNPAPPQPRLDEEQGTHTSHYKLPSTLRDSSLLPPRTHTSDLSPAVDSLALFRLMVGITTAPDLGHSSLGARPADNIGLYARVVHSEQMAKDSYKVFSAVINGSYFLQIIVAAALTALGAANANNKAITAFGAINTVIAGLLTYLKGSGLPGRLKYFGGEWKKIREYIEQRERDFSTHDGCGLDVYEEIQTVRDMYDSTKRDIEMNTPDTYNARPGNATVGVPGGGLHPGVPKEAVEKLKVLDQTVRKLESKLEPLVEKVENGFDKGREDVKEAAFAVHEEEKKQAGEARTFGRGVVDRVGQEVERARHKVERARHDVREAVHTAHEEEKKLVAEARMYGRAALDRLESLPPHRVSATLEMRHAKGEKEDGAGK